MSRLQDDVSSGFLQARRIYVDSADRSNGTVSDYEFKLPIAIPNVVSIELTGFSIPDSLTPSFQPGTDAVDFSVTRGGLTKIFTFRWPSNSYVYSTNVENQSFTNTLQRLMTNAIFSDPDFGAGSALPVTFLCQPTPDDKTWIYCSAFASLLFGTGPNRNEAANKQLGFLRVDYDFIPPTVGSTDSYLTGPNPVILEPIQRIEISIDEIPEYSPLAVLYNPSEEYQTMNDISFRSRFLDESPPRLLSKLTIHVRADGKPIVSALKNEHSLSFTAYCFTHSEVPSWLTQYIAI
jgi:hypothetical protein